MSELTPLYRAMAADGHQFHGLSILQHTKQIKTLVHEHGAKSLIDWGCGRGDAYRSPHKAHHAWGIKRKDVMLYDPSFPAHDTEPARPADVVLCSDVLEHVPEAEVDAFVGKLFKHAKLAVWASVCCRPAKKCFPGTVINLHVTLHPLEWWQAVFARHAAASGVAFYLVETP